MRRLLLSVFYLFLLYHSQGQVTINELYKYKHYRLQGIDTTLNASAVKSLSAILSSNDLIDKSSFNYRFLSKCKNILILSLNIQGNEIDNIPFGTFRQLKVLSLTTENLILNKEVSNQFYEMKDVEVIHWYKPDYLYMSKIEKFHHLKELHLHFDTLNEVEMDSIFHYINRNKHIQRVVISSRNYIGQSIPESIELLANLQEIELDINAINLDLTWGIPFEVYRMKKVRRILIY